MCFVGFFFIISFIGHCCFLCLFFIISSISYLCDIVIFAVFILLPKEFQHVDNKVVLYCIVLYTHAVETCERTF